MKEQVFVPKTPNIFAIMTGPPSTIGEANKKRSASKNCTIVNGWPGIMAKIFGVFGTKICYFIKKNMT